MGGLAAPSIGLLARARNLIAKPADHPLQPGAYQRQIGRAGCEQRHGERDMHAFAGGLQDRFHDPQNIRRFYPVSLGQYFSGDSGLVYDSGTPTRKAANPSESVGSPASPGREPQASAAMKLSRARRVGMDKTEHDNALRPVL